ncbi:UNVERIFIED_CONTAM: hypothetical protein FKN15_064068 [Acipenser sinensis]
MEEGEEPVLSTEAEPSSRVASEASAPLFSSSMSALMGPAANFLQVPWSTEAEPRRFVFRTPSVLPSVPGFHGLSGPSAKCAEASGSARFLGRCGEAGPGRLSPSGFHHCSLGQGSAGGGLTQGPCMPKPAMQGHGNAPEAGIHSRSTDTEEGSGTTSITPVISIFVNPTSNCTIEGQTLLTPGALFGIIVCIVVVILILAFLVHHILKQRVKCDASSDFKSSDAEQEVDLQQVTTLKYA